MDFQDELLLAKLNALGSELSTIYDIPDELQNYFNNESKLETGEKIKQLEQYDKLFSECVYIK